MNRAHRTTLEQAIAEKREVRVTIHRPANHRRAADDELEWGVPTELHAEHLVWRPRANPRHPERVPLASITDVVLVGGPR